MHFLKYRSYSYEQNSSLTQITSNPYSRYGFFIVYYISHVSVCLTCLSLLGGIYYTGSHLYMYINYKILIIVLFRGGEDEVEWSGKETLEPRRFTGVMNPGSRMNAAGRKETLVAISSRDLTSLAARTMITRRKQVSNPEMSLLIPRINPNPWRTTGPLEKSMVIKNYCGYRPVMGRGTDASCMHRYLEKIEGDGIQKPQEINMEEFLPAGAPLLDFLASTVDRLESWKYPPGEEIKFYQKARNLSYKLLDEVMVKEIIVGETSDEEIRSIASWMWDQWEKDQRMNPTQIMSLDNEEIRISLYDIYRLSGKIECEFPRAVSKEEDRKRPGLPEDRPCQLPTKIMFGNGLSYCVIISIKLERNSRGEYLLHRIKVQEEVVKLLEALPVCTGLGIKGDVTDIEFYYSLLAGRTVSLQGYIDLAALAVISGYNLMAKSMTPMGVQVIGHTLNKCCSTGDGKWAYGWHEIPESLQLYGIADIMFGHMCYSILSTILVRDIFPDPEITCKFFNVPDQWFAIAWINELICWSLDGIEIHNVDFDKAKSREEMILSLRYRYSAESPLMEESPAKVKIWCKLIGGWPSLTNGGCRYLLQAREKFLEQAQVLKKSKFKWRLKVTMRELTNSFKEYARFGLSKEAILECNFLEPAPFHYGLLRPRSCPVPPLFMNPEKIKPGTIGKLVKKQDRKMKPVIFEWARMNPHKIQYVFERLTKDEAFRKFLYGTYQGLRMIYRRLYNKEAVRINELDVAFIDNIACQLIEEEERARKSREMYKARKDRCEHLRSVLRAKDDEDQTLCLEELPRLPDWKPRRRGRKRMRSRSRSRAGAKRINVQSQDPAEPPGQISAEDQPKEVQGDQVVEQYAETREIRMIDPAAEIVMIEIESDEDPDLVGINDPKPSCRKIMPEKRKNKGKKKGKRAPTPVRTYDEIIESGTYKNSDDEFDLETYFSGDII